ncbi:MAG: ABC transporter permease subunit [Oligoflexia bacterium]|nr:ABC transporter permease subunit [Oligoflexia bacterium]
MSLTSGFRWVATIWTLFFGAVCVGAPVSALFSRLHGGTLFDPDILSLVRVTVTQAGASAMIAAVIGLPLGLLIAAGGAAAGARSARAFFFNEMLLAIPFSVPTAVAASSWVLILGRNGWLARLGIPLDWSYSLKAVITAHVFFNAPWIALWVAQARDRIPEGRFEAALTLGASAFSRFRFLEWPAVKWSFFAAATQAFSFCVMSFALVLILGGGPPVQTLETAVYSRLRFGTLDVGGAAACAAWELLVTLLPWAAVLFFQARDPGRGARPARERARGVGSFGARSWLPGVAFFAAAVFLLPYLAIFPASWRSIDIVPWSKEVLPAVAVSVKIAVTSAFFVVLTALAAVMSLSSPRLHPAVTTALASLASLSGGISALVLGLGFWLAFGRWVDPFEGSFAAIVAIQLALFFNVAFRIFWPLAQEPRRNLLEAAATLGADPARAFFEIEWPRWRSSVAGAFALVAAASIGEVAAVSLFYSEKLVPLPLLIVRWSAQYRFEAAQSASALLFVLSSGTVASVFISFHWRGARD